MSVEDRVRPGRAGPGARTAPAAPTVPAPRAAPGPAARTGPAHRSRRAGRRIGRTGRPEPAAPAAAVAEAGRPDALDLDLDPAAPPSLRGLGWGLVVAVLAAVVLVVSLLVVVDRWTPDDAAPTPPRPQPPLTSASPPPTPAGRATPPARRPARPAVPRGRAVSAGAIGVGWEDWSWDSAVEPGASTPDGVPAVLARFGAPWAGFSVRSATPLRVSAGSVLSVRLYVSGRAARIGIHTQAADRGGLSRRFDVTLPADRWQTVTLPVSRLGSPTTVRRINLMDRSGNPQGTVLWVASISLR